MSLVTTILLLLFITAITNLITRIVRVPLPLMQIAAGALCDYAGFHVTFDPALFLLLFIPPLLFADAYRIPKRELGEVGVAVVLLAVGLALFTVLGVGYFVHWLLPFMPLAAAFALAAVLSPTDAVALSGIMRGQTIPRRFMHVLQGEALLNDASGLVCFNFAVVAVLTGSFSLGLAAMSFVGIAAGGLAIGGLFGWMFLQLDRRILSRQTDETSIYIVLTLLLPFASYLAAESVGCSGILAAVASGLILNAVDPFGGSQPLVRRRTIAVWGVMEFAFNGLIFLLLGLQLPSILRNGIAITEHAHRSGWALLLLIILVSVALVVLRFLWVTLTLYLRYFSTRFRKVTWQHPGWLSICVASVAGVRGAVTLAGILSLPLMMGDRHFPTRELMISIAAGVIICSLLLATIALPPLVRRLPVPEVDPLEVEVGAARRAMAHSAIREIERVLPGALAKRTGSARAAYQEAAERVLAHYQLKIQGRDDEDDNQEHAQEDQRADHSIRLRAVHAERAEMQKLRHSHTINDEAVQLLIEEMDIEEEALTHMAGLIPSRREV